MASSRSRRRRWLRSLGVSTRVVPALLAGVFRLVAVTLRVRQVGGDDRTLESRHRLAASWHQGLLVGACVFRDRGFTVPVSRSRDGDLAVAVMTRLGWSPPPRGSSSRGGSTLLREMVRRVERGDAIVMLPDGPRGPARRAKPGVVALARLTGRAIVPVGISARPRIRFGSWDETLLPLPFARVVCCYGEPIAVSAEADGDALERARTALERELDRLTEAAEAELGISPTPASP